MPCFLPGLLLTEIHMPGESCPAVAGSLPLRLDPPSRPGPQAEGLAVGDGSPRTTLPPSRVSTVGSARDFPCCVLPSDLAVPWFQNLHFPRALCLGPPCRGLWGQPLRQVALCPRQPPVPLCPLSCQDALCSRAFFEFELQIELVVPARDSLHFPWKQRF